MPMPRSEYLSDEVWKPGQFAGRVVFCTGGAGDICSAQVRALVDLGADACIVGRNKEKTERVAKDIAATRQGARVIGIGEIDVRKKESLQGAVDRCVSELGGVDILIAGAAGNFLAPLMQISENAFKSVVEIDLLGSYNTVKAALPALLKSAEKAKASGKPGPRIIFVSATLHYTGMPLQTHVTAAKAGVDALSQQCAIELGPFGITSNVIAPGGIADTEGMRRLSRQSDGNAAVKHVPLQRAGTVKDIADATIWICGSAANYVNGVALVVDGGAWRVNISQPGKGFQYPDFLLSGDAITGVAGMKKDKSKL